MQSNFPIGATITVADMAENPYPTFASLLAEEPISWVPAYGVWMVCRRVDVMEILRDAERFTMEPPPGQVNPMEDTFGPMMLSIDGPEHKRIRDAFIEPYRPKHVREFYAELIKRICDRLLAEMCDAGGCDLDKAFSDRLAIYTVVATLGFEVNDIRQFRDWYDEFALAIGNTVMDPAVRNRGQRAFAQFKAMVLRQIERLRQAPNHSVLSQIIHDQQANLSLDEIVANVALNFFGGVETTSAMLSNSAWALLQAPEQLNIVRHNISALPQAIEEAIRWEAPVQAAMRFPTGPVKLHGVSIEQGAKIYCMLGAANRDPTLFDRPDHFDIARANADKHLSFAYGPHFCFGAPLARLEARIGLSKLLKQFPRLRLDPARLSRPYGHEFRSTPELFVEW